MEINRNSNSGTEQYPLTSDEEILNSVRNGLPRYYRPAGLEIGEMPYHNIDHAISTEETVIEHVKYVRSHGKRVDAFALRFAALMHDAGFHEQTKSQFIESAFKRSNCQDTHNNWLSSSTASFARGVNPKDFPTSTRFETKEEYASWQAKILAESYGVKAARVRKIGRLILVTQGDMNPKSLEEKIMVRADIHNASGPYSPFFANTLNLLREAEMLSGPKNILERVGFMREALNQHIDKDLCFGDFDKEAYENEFRNPAIANVSKLATKSVESTIRLIGEKGLRLIPGFSHLK